MKKNIKNYFDIDGKDVKHRVVGPLGGITPIITTTTTVTAIATMGVT